tara:strand:+ start:591 stop:1823 length:1233 start_codon:yes stop_codon:yes gene_type:complete
MFSLGGAFGRGFVEAATDRRQETRSVVEKASSDAFLQALEEAQETRKERNARKKRLQELAASLELFGLNEQQTIGVMSMGEEGAKDFLAQAREARKLNKDFDVSKVVTVAEKTNMTITDAINKTMGELKKPEQSKLPAFAQKDKGLFDIDRSKTARKQFELLGEAYGEDFDTISAEAAGDYTTEALPTGAQIDYSLFKTPPSELDKAKTALYRKQAEEIQADIDALGKTEPLKPSDQRATTSLVAQSLGPALANFVGEGVRYDAEKGEFFGTNVDNKRAAQARAIINKSAEEGINLLNGDMATYYRANIGRVINYLGDTYLPNEFGVNVALPETETSAPLESTVVPMTSGDAEIKVAGLKAEYNAITQRKQKENFKKSQRKSIAQSLMQGGMSKKDAMNEARRIVKDALR